MPETRMMGTARTVTHYRDASRRPEILDHWGVYAAMGHAQQIAAASPSVERVEVFTLADGRWTFYAFTR